ncbi:histone methyltransferase set1 [Oleoguttula sp. CCFEE 5521]
MGFVTDTPKHTRRKGAKWDKDKKEVFDGTRKQLLGHVLNKELENLATRELEQVLNTLPRPSSDGMEARTELYIWQLYQRDDGLFNIKKEQKNNLIVDFVDDVETAGKEQPSTLAVEIDAKAVMERLRRSARAKIRSWRAVEELAKSDVGWGFTHNKPRRTVENDRDLILDIDGWQDFIKDDENLAEAKRGLREERACDVRDVKFWA